MVITRPPFYFTDTPYDDQAKSSRQIEYEFVQLFMTAPQTREILFGLAAEAAENVLGTTFGPR
jgi:hypothetical protein